MPGTAASSMRVYVLPAGVPAPGREGPCSTTRPWCITSTSIGDLGDDAHVVGDEEHRHALLGAAARLDEPQHLLLCRHVERGRRLVADAEVRVSRSPPSQSRCAGAGRPRAGAENCASCAAPSGRRTRSSTRRISVRRFASRAPVGVRLRAARRSGRRSSSPGFSAVIGSWNTMPIALPRSARRRCALAWSSDSPCRRMAPRVARSSRGRRPIVVVASTDLPEPDSPTMQSVLPAATKRLTPATASGRSAPAGRATSSASTTRTGAAVVMRCASRTSDRARRAGRRRAG